MPYLILFFMLFAVTAQAHSGSFESVEVKKLNARTVEVRTPQPDIVKTYQMVEVIQDIQTLNNEIEAEAKRCESTIMRLESKRDKLVAVYDANPPPEPKPEPIKEPVVESIIDPIVYPDLIDERGVNW